jgi:excisionase family DNA binding protein
MRRSSRNSAQARRPSSSELPDRLLTVFEVAAIIGCHEETVRRAYLCGQLLRQRFGVRSWRFHAEDVQDWLARGAPTTCRNRGTTRTDGPSRRLLGGGAHGCTEDL